MEERMASESLHISDEILLLFSEGELSASNAAKINAHLARCERCGARLNEMERTLAEFVLARRQGESLPSVTMRDMLIARMKTMKTTSGNPARNSWSDWIRFTAAPSWKGYAFAVVLLCAVSLVAVYRRELGTRLQQTALKPWTEPKSDLTPGMILPVTAAQLCSSAAEQQPPVVPASLQRRVFAMYGMNDASSEAYELDYLITPQLGGATDIRNLWPEPYFDTAWNAHVKDQLEDRLHEMVCHGEVDLGTAQHDIAKDWIAAYRKYFHTENPLADGASDRL
jgi:hypothetical protein